MSLPDTTSQEDRKSIIELRFALMDYAINHSMDELLTRALDEIGALTGSPIGFFHFIEEDQKTITLQQWSTATLERFCAIDKRELHYGVEKAGVWADSVRLKEPIIHNDYKSLPEKKGMPPGHAEVVRELVVPVMRGERIVAILGVGNKPQPYIQRDLELVSYCADVAWEIIDRKHSTELINLHAEIDGACAELSATLLGTRDLDHMAERVLETAKKLTRSRLGFVGTVDRGSGQLIVNACDPGLLSLVDSSGERPVLSRFTGPWGWVLTNKKPLMHNDLSADAGLEMAGADQLPVRAFLGVPAISRERVVGIIALAEPVNAFVDIDLTIAFRIADLFVQALERHRLERDLIRVEAKKAEELERLVQVRTIELKKSNRALQEEIDHREKVERQLIDSRNMLQLVFDGIQEPLLLLDQEGTILMLNATAGRYFETAAEKARGRRCAVITPHSSFCQTCRILKAIREKTSINFERKINGNRDRIEHIFVDMLPSSDDVNMAIVRIHDVTEVKMMEKEMMQADKLISLGTLVSGVAHEINNPNNFISLNTNLLKDAWQSLKPVLEKYAQEYGDFLVAGLPYSEMKVELPNLLLGIEAGSRRIQRIVQELKDYSMPNLDRMDELLNLNLVTQQAISLIASKIAKHTENFTVLYGADLPPGVGNSQKLEQVIINLLLNACQSLTEKNQRVHLVTSHDDATDSLCIEISDEGRGIAKEVLARVKDPFFTTRRDSGGTGLGLSVSSKIIEEHHGRLDIDSELGKGSTFTILLPVHHPPTQVRKD